MNEKPKILIADDSEINRALLKEILGDGYDYLEAEDGAAAVELMRQRTDISLLLLDLMMPGMDGFDVLRVMKYHAWLDEIPVIVISAAEDTANIERAYDLGVADYIRRPFERIMILRRVKNILMLYAKQKRLTRLVTDQVYEKEHNSVLMISILSHVVEFRNSESGLHVMHIRTLTDLLLHQLVRRTDRYQLDEIGHDPYQLISHLTAVYEQFTRGQVKPVIKELFKQQYLLKVWETIEIRTRMETRVGIRPTIDAFGNISMETYTYQEEVEYEYKILNVLLKNKGFDTIARKNMNRKQTGRYDAYNLTYGNRPELFGAGSPTYSGGTTGSIGTGGGAAGSGGFKYDIPSEALSDEKFARMIEEAEKYLGMPYVWGGSSPSTSFDCSGFVCWVINNCGNGWSVGRTTANGLRGKCSYVSPADAQPGDLIFFEKTYNTAGASHVGIYVGNGMMIHCGDPISYTSINSTYWQSHFLGFGRIN